MVTRSVSAEAAAEAAFQRGEAARLGEGRVIDFATAEAQYRRAAGSGHEGACAELGIMLFKLDRREDAMPWIARAAHAGDARACYIFGVALHNGDLVAADPALARQMLDTAAEAGLRQAREALAELDGDARGAAPELGLPPGPRSLEELVESLLRPLLRERLETMLPEQIRLAVSAALMAR